MTSMIKREKKKKRQWKYHANPNLKLHIALCYHVSCMMSFETTDTGIFCYYTDFNIQYRSIEFILMSDPHQRHSRHDHEKPMVGIESCHPTLVSLAVFLERDAAPTQDL